ncbi:unnamed protein product [Musa banksii]
MFNNDQYRIFYKKNNFTIAIISLSSNKVFPFIMAILKYDNLNIKSLQLLKQRNMMLGLPYLQARKQICEDYIYEKMHRLLFLKTSWRAKLYLEFIHTDVCGPFRTTSVNNRRTNCELKKQKKSMIDHLKVFGSISYAHISSQNRDIFDEKDEKCC